jgi:hypothetical protein
LAKLFEEKCKPLTRNLTTKPNSFNIPNPNRTTNPPLLQTPNTKPTPNYPKNQNIKRMTSAEMQLRREKGQCYTCEDKWSFNHKCPNRGLMILQIDEAPSEYEDVSEDQIDSGEDKQLELHLSFNALKGSTGVGTIKFTRHIGKMPIQILVDGGSSDNFLQPRIAHFLKLDIAPAPLFKVLVGNGNSLSPEGSIPELCVAVQNHDIKIPVYLLPIVGADLILGATWLATLGPHVADYKALSIKFFDKGKYITLQGERSQVPQQAQLHHMRRLYQTDAIEACFAIHRAEPVTKQDCWLELPTDMEPELVLLLNRFKEVFHKPTGLPPPRLQNHTIPLMEGK